SVALRPTLPPDCSPLSLHDALPIYFQLLFRGPEVVICPGDFRHDLVREAVAFSFSETPFNASLAEPRRTAGIEQIEREAGSNGIDRKSTRLNSSHEWISYAVFCLTK